MKKMSNILKKIFKNDSKKEIITLVVIACLIIFLLVVMNLQASYDSKQEGRLSESLKQMGKEFYTDFYYEQISIGQNKTQISQFLEKFSSIGLRISLDSLGRYDSDKNSEKIKAFVNNKTQKKCDKNNTVAIIYPKAPYGKNDYTIDAKVECGFKK